MTPECDATSDLIGPYVDDGLPERTRRRVEEHLLRCRDCAWEATTMRIARERLRADAGEAAFASDAFRTRTLTRLRADNPHLAPENDPTVPGPAQFELPIS